MVEPQALIAVLLRKRPDLIRYFTKRTGSPAAAEDIVQEIYLKITSAPLPDHIQSPEAYLYRTGSNLMLDRLKADRRRLERDRDWERARRAGARADRDAAAAPDDLLAAQQHLEQLRALLDELPPAVARAFRLHRLEGLTQGEVADRMGLSRSSVEKYIMTAVRHLLEKGPF